MIFCLYNLEKDIILDLIDVFCLIKYNKNDMFNCDLLKFTLKPIYIHLYKYLQNHIYINSINKTPKSKTPPNMMKLSQLLINVQNLQINTENDRTWELRREMQALGGEDLSYLNTRNFPESTSNTVQSLLYQLMDRSRNIETTVNIMMEKLNYLVQVSMNNSKNHSGEFVSQALEENRQNVENQELIFGRMGHRNILQTPRFGNGIGGREGLKFPVQNEDSEHVQPLANMNLKPHLASKIEDGRYEDIPDQLMDPLDLSNEGPQDTETQPNLPVQAPGPGHFMPSPVYGLGTFNNSYNSYTNNYYNGQQLQPNKRPYGVINNGIDPRMISQNDATRPMPAQYQSFKGKHQENSQYYSFGGQQAELSKLGHNPMQASMSGVGIMEVPGYLLQGGPDMGSPRSLNSMRAGRGGLSGFMSDIPHGMNITLGNNQILGNVEEEELEKDEEEEEEEEEENQENEENPENKENPENEEENEETQETQENEEENEEIQESVENQDTIEHQEDGQSEKEESEEVYTQREPDEPKSAESEPRDKTEDPEQENQEIKTDTTENNTKSRNQETESDNLKIGFEVKNEPISRDIKEDFGQKEKSQNQETGESTEVTKIIDESQEMQKEKNQISEQAPKKRKPNRKKQKKLNRKKRRQQQKRNQTQSKETFEKINKIEKIEKENKAKAKISEKLEISSVSQTEQEISESVKSETKNLDLSKSEVKVKKTRVKKKMKRSKPHVVKISSKIERW